MASISGPKYNQGTTRLTDQIIEEADEQMTIQSQRSHDIRPTAQSIFATYDEKEKLHSEPIDVPTTRAYTRTQSAAQNEHQPYNFPNNAIYSTSAPDEHTVLKIQTPTINIDDSLIQVDNIADIESRKKTGDKGKGKGQYEFSTKKAQKLQLA